MEKEVISSGQMHRPVLYQEILESLRPVVGGYYVDCTLGAGGHAWGLLAGSEPDGKLLGFDLDPQAIELARQKLLPFGERAVIVQASYTQLAEYLSQLGWGAVQGIMLDLGVSSMQLDTPERGFSFQEDAPLDMRFSPEGSVTAADLVNTLSEAELVRILFEFGEEAKARQIVRMILQHRPLASTRQLASLILNEVGSSYKGERKHPGKSRIHPATKTFQALRIAVNQELEAVRSVLPQAINALAPGGRLAVISFHSLEDRIVKRYFRLESQDCLCPARQPVCTCGHKASIVEISRRPIMAGDAEIQANPRARSARLRVAEKI